MADEALASPGTKSWLYHPVFPEHWERRALYSLARWVNGLAFRDIQFGPTGRPVIKIAEIKGGISGQTKFTEQVFGDAVHVRAGDLLFSWSGQPETSIDAFWWRGVDGWLNQHSFRVTPAEGIDPTFFFYLLRYLKPSFVGIARNKQTTGLGHVTKRDLENIEAAYPCLPEQRAIAHMLGTLDDKIELNRRMNETLEAMARALFKSWFVDFDPVHAKAEGRDQGLPKLRADLFPDSFENSELGEIPKGWRVGPILETACLLSGGTPKTDRDEYWSGSIPWASAKDVSQCGDSFLIETERKITARGLDESATQLIPALCSVVVARGATTGRMAVLGDAMAMNQTCYALATTIGTPFALYCHLREEIPKLVHAAHGSVFDTITTSTFATSKVVIPPNRAFVEFERRVDPMFRRVMAGTKASRTLAALRDALLPKLISGELCIKDATRITVEASA